MECALSNYLSISWMEFVKMFGEMNNTGFRNESNPKELRYDGSMEDVGKKL